MTRKHYIEVAGIVRAEREARPDNVGAVCALSNVALELALMFKRDNSHFDAGRFFEAAGFPELTATRMGLN